MMLDFLKEALEGANYPVETASDPRQGLEIFKTSSPDLVITDIKMPGTSGLALLAEFRKLNRRIPVIVITAYADLEKAEKAIRYGASDFIKKPFEAPQIIKAVERQLSTQNKTGKKQQPVYASDKMEKIVALARDIAQRSDPLLIQGESGVGKEVIARYVHYQSERFDAPLVAVNCGAIPDELLESELFGHTEGAFTGASQDREGLFQAATGGTLFLDEIGEIPVGLQARLLRALENKEIRAVGSDKTEKVDVRIIAASNRSLQKMVEEGSFRADLFYRLNVFLIDLPPLRERPEDIPVLFKHFMDEYNVKFTIPVDLMDRLSAHPWPGNVRQIQNVIRRLDAVAGKGEIDVENLKMAGLVLETSAVIEKGLDFPPQPDLPGKLEQIKKEYIKQALTETEHNQAAAARLLGMNRTTLIETIKRLNIEQS